MNKQPKLSNSIIRIIIKSLILLICINFAWIEVEQLPYGKLSLYNSVLSGRERLPFGENPSNSYNLSLFNMDAMLASHRYNGQGSQVESYDVVLIGDSSVWGFLQKPEENLAGLLNKRFAATNSNITVYNLGYPSISLLKDILIIDKTVEKNPDLVIWLTTLEAFPIESQMEIPIVKNNPRDVIEIIKKYNLTEFEIPDDNPLGYTFWNQRRNIADIIDLQVYGLLWDATGIDQEYPSEYNPAQRNFPEPKNDFYGAEHSDDLNSILSFEILANCIAINSHVDFVVVNEPILISEGENSDVQYNYYYPKWAYDQYRILIKEFTQKNKISYYDFWDLVQQEEFTNSAIHLTINGEKILADKVTDIINEQRTK